MLCDDPVVDDRWLYEIEEESSIKEKILNREFPRCIALDEDLTLVGSGYSTHLCKCAADQLSLHILCEVFDLRILNPMDLSNIVRSVKKQGI